MKKTILAITSIILVASSIMVFYACEKEKAITASTDERLVDSKEIVSKKDIDNLSRDIATFHNHILLSIVRNEDLPKTLDVKELIMQVRTQMLKEMDRMDIPHLRPYLEAYADLEESEKESISMLIECGFSCDLYSFINDSVLFKVKKEEINKVIISNFFESESYEDYENMCQNDIARVLSNINSSRDYMELRLYADITRASFAAWCEYFYGTLKSKDIHSGWQNLKKKVKHKVEEVVAFGRELDPYIEADFDGAVYGMGLFGGCAIIANAIPGAGQVAEGLAVGLGAAVGTVVGSVRYNNRQQQR